MPSIPKVQIRYIVDRMHVGQPDYAVKNEVRRRIRGHPGWTESLIRQAEQYAVATHHENQKMYSYVMGGKVGQKRNPSWRRSKKGMGTAALYAPLFGGKRIPSSQLSPLHKAHRTKVRQAYRYQVEEGRRRRRLQRSNPVSIGPGVPDIQQYIRAGDRVTIVDRFGHRRTGRATLRGPSGWVLNMGGPHGTPLVTGGSNVVVKVVKGRQ